MGQTFFVEVPLRTPQVRSAHPFFVGHGGQTKNSRNLWVDERGRLRRRPAVVEIGDAGSKVVSGMFDYQFRDRASNTVRFLIGWFEDASGPHVGIMTNHPFSDRTTSATCPRLLLRDASFDWSTASGFSNREPVLVYRNANNGSSSSGSLVGSGFVVADNVDLSGPSGSLIVSGSFSTTLTASYRVQNVSGTMNVLFDEARPAPSRQVIWSGTAKDTNAEAIPSFAQFGKGLFLTDDTHKAPVRFWTGGGSEIAFVRDAPRGSILFTHQGRLWITGLRDDASAIVGSGVLDPLRWSLDRTNRDDPIYLTIEQDDQDEVTGASPSYYGDLYVWKRSSLHRIRGIIQHQQPGEGITFTRETVTRAIGAISHRTIRHVGQDIMWMSDRGVHSLARTEKFGDVEEHDLSFPIADVFEDLNFARLRMSQAVYLNRLGVYLLGVPRRGSSYLNRLLAFMVRSQMWHVWDAGDFTALSLGPPLGSDVETVYATLSDGTLAVLDFGSQVDVDTQVFSGTIENTSLFSGITTVIEPGILFAVPPQGLDASVRYAKKQISQMQVYIAPKGSSATGTLVHSWDSGAEVRQSIDLNPDRQRPVRLDTATIERFPGNELGSDDDTAIVPLRLTGQGRLAGFRIEDDNQTDLPYLHVDLEAEILDLGRTPATREG